MHCRLRIVSGLLAFLVLASFQSARAEVRLEQVISRESPLFRCQLARMAVGRDGMVYLTSDFQGKAICLRLSRDGSQKRSGEVIYAIHNATANPAGVIATANAHFNHSLNLYAADFQKLAAADDFLVNDQVGWDAPSHVEAGPSGDFYGIDQHRNRMVRVGPDGKIKAVYPIRADHESDWGKPTDFRINESLKSFYFLANGHLVRTAFDGTVTWKIPVPVQYRWDIGSNGGLDIDDAGNVLLIEGNGATVKQFDVNGKASASIDMQMGDLKPSAAAPIIGLRVAGDDIVIRRTSSTELFQVYDRATGRLKHVESIDHEFLAVTFPSLVWKSGASIPVSINFRSAAGQGSPRFRLWISPFGISDWRELPRDKDSKVVIPDDYAGLYQIKVTPEVLPRQTDEPSEYLVREIIEVRRPGSQGTVAVVTPFNRTHYSATDESLRGRVILRSPTVSAERVEVRLRTRATGAILATRSVDLVKTTDQPGRAEGSFHFDHLDRLFITPAECQLDVEVPNLTCVPQRLFVGRGTEGKIAFRKMLYGDYGLTSPQRNAWEAADSAASHGERMKKLGLNQFVNRTHQLSLDFPNDDSGRGLLTQVKQRLDADPMAVPSERAEFGSAHHAIAGWYSAMGWRELLILVYMDGGLPLGTGHDRRTPAQFAETIQRFTEAFSDYPGFAGWAWVANWWLYDQNAKFATAEEKAEYETALKSASTGNWNPILDRVDDRKYGYAVEAQAIFNKALNETSKRIAEKTGRQERSLITATAGPYRRPEVLPEINFANVDEIDIQYQAEQITTPDWVPHGIDVSRRAGQSAWIHPELWNDLGNGEQILPSSWLAIMRGTDGLGTAGTIPNWPGGSMDSRLGFHGTTTVFRSMFRAVDQLSDPVSVIRQSLQPGRDGDRVGIVVSPRQQKIETFSNGIGSTTFSRQFEAYQSFLYANCSARFVSLEEVRQRSQPTLPEGLAKSFDALLLVGQNVELEPEWQQFLKHAKSSGVRILMDGTCRKDACPDAEPLGLSFDVIEKEHSVNSDYAHYVYPARFRANALALRPVVDALKAASRRPRDVASLVEAAVDGDPNHRPVILLQEHPTARGGRIVLVINNSPTTLPPGQLRKVGRAIATRSPAVAHLKFELAPGQKVVDLFSRQPVAAEVVADLRDTFARMYWVGSSDADMPKPQEASPSAAPRLDQSFGPHLRDIAIDADQSTALVNAFNWDHNLYGLDLATGKVRFRERIGDHFGYGPLANATGFAVQGFDLNSAEGYHLYAVDRNGQATRRFALPGIPGCQTSWSFTSTIQDRVNNFATPAAGDWVAASGNLGVAVWNRDGSLLWSEDWSTTKRQSLLLLALDKESLVTATGMTVAARQATTGQELWSMTLANSGEILGLHASSDGHTLAIRSNHAGGRVYLLKDGKRIGHLPTAADDLSVSRDGGIVAVANGHQLKVYGRAAGADANSPLGLKWLAQGDDPLRFPRVAEDGQRIAVCSEIGTLSIFGADGNVLHRRDEYGIVIPAWLKGDELLVASWNGSVARIDANGRDRWRTHVRQDEPLPLATAIASTRRIADPPTSRFTGWAQARPEIPQAANLLAPNQFITRWMMGTQASNVARETNELADGKFDLTNAPNAANAQGNIWLPWYDHGMIESGWRGEFAMIVDSFNKQFRIDAITFVEDPRHPESWLRDMRCEYWDADAERWVFVEFLTSDSVVHSHKLKKPIEAARIRFVKSDGHAWPVGNVRLQELMLHGQVLGASHPDVVARRPVAVLFDENVASIKSSYEHGHNFGLKFATGAEAFQGGNYITVPGDKNYGALWQPPFGHMTPDWWFEVVEKPEAGQYRYLQFSVKGLSADTRGVTVRVAPSHYGGIGIHLGVPTPSEGAVMHQESGSVPLQWQTVTVDLWKLLPENQRGKPLNIGSMTLGTVGGPVAIDRIRLGRTLEDLKEPEKKE